MGKQIQFDYYYGIEAEQFSFYRVPRLLIKDERFKGLSSDAKLLYSLLAIDCTPDSLDSRLKRLPADKQDYLKKTFDFMIEQALKSA